MKIRLPLPAVFFAAAACCLRLAQNRFGFEQDTLLPVPGSLPALALPLLLAAAGGLLAAWTVRHLPPAEHWQGTFLPGDSRGGTGLALTGLALLAGGGVWDLFIAAAQQQSAVTAEGMRSAAALGQTMLGAGALGAAVCLLSALCLPRPGKGNCSPGLLTAPILLLLRLVFVYRIHSADPVLGHYYLQLLSEMTLILGTYRLSGMTVGCGRPRYLGFYAAMAPVLSLTVIADGISPAALVSLGGTAAFWGFCLLLRISPTPEEAPNPAEESPPAA